MKLIPYDRVTIEVPATIDEVIVSLRRHVEPTNWIRLSGSNGLFEGEVRETGFRIRRIIHYRNSFIPVLYGSFEARQSSTVVHVRMTLHWFVIVFLCYWFGMLGMFSVVGFMEFVDNGGAVILLACGGMGLFAVLLTLVGFWFEVPKAKRLLQEVLAT